MLPAPSRGLLSVVSRPRPSCALLPPPTLALLARPLPAPPLLCTLRAGEAGGELKSGDGVTRLGCCVKRSPSSS